MYDNAEEFQANDTSAGWRQTKWLADTGAVLVLKGPFVITGLLAPTNPDLRGENG